MNTQDRGKLALLVAEWATGANQPEIDTTALDEAEREHAEQSAARMEVAALLVPDVEEHFRNFPHDNPAELVSIVSVLLAEGRIEQHNFDCDLYAIDSPENPEGQIEIRKALLNYTAQTPDEIIDALVTALAKNVVRFGLSDKHIRRVESHLALAIDFQRELAASETRRDAVQ
jgi:predicted Zn-dependent protease with MMP-like domain